MLKYETLVVGEMATNCYLVWSEDKSAVVIDPGDEGTEIAQRINELGLKPMAILLTHGHFDHVLGVIDLKLIYQIPVAMGKDDIFLVERAEKSAEYFLKKKMNKIKVKISQISTKEIKELRLGSEVIEVVKTPGHTPGGVCFYCPEEGWLFDGDMLFAEGQGETTHEYSSKSEMTKSIQKILNFPNGTLILPGHGESFII